MALMPPQPHAYRLAVTPTGVVVAVLVASVVVASLLAFQAIAAARSRQAVSDAMLRQYAELAAWEFSREARKQIDSALNHLLARDAHPEGRGECDCAHLEPVLYAFQFTDRGVQGRSAAMPDELSAAITPHMQWARTGSWPIHSIKDRTLMQSAPSLISG